MRVAANFFSLALLELIGVKIPQSQSWVITDAPHPCTHTGSWITISFVRLIALLHLKKNLVWGFGLLHECTNLDGIIVFKW